MQKQNTALLVMDMQAGILSRLADATAIKTNVSKAIAKARETRLQVIYVVLGFRQGMPEVSPNNAIFHASKQQMGSVDLAKFSTVEPSLNPLDTELVVTKKRVSAFTGSDLEVVLRSLQVTHLILTGVATSGVVLSTLREAADKDYRITVISDCCADGDEEVHRVLTTKIFPRQAEVLTLDAWLGK